MQLPVPSLINVREHNIYALNLLNVYFLLVEGDMLPGYHSPDFLQRLSVRLLLNKIEAATPSETLRLNPKEIKTIYAAYLLSNKLLATTKSEYISGMILQQLPQGHELKDFRSFCKSMRESNTHLIKATEREHTHDIEDFTEWKEKLEAFVIEWRVKNF